MDLLSVMTTSTLKKNSPLTQLLKADSGLVATVKAGDLVDAEFIELGAKKAFFDLKKFGTGIVYGIEFVNAQDTIKKLSLGEKVLAKVVDADGDDGYVELSLSEADKQKSWQSIKELQESGEVISVMISGANAGGLITSINDLKAFLPVSQLAVDHYPKIDDGDRAKITEELKKLVGQELRIKVIDFNSRTNKLIVSEREQISGTNTKELLVKYKVGDVIDGIVSGITDFGVFIKFANDPDLEGLIHISELSHQLVENPKDIVKLSDVIQVKIVDIKDGRVSLSLKALRDNPWDTVGEKYKVDDKVSGIVSRFNPFGAFITLDASIQGLIHVSQFGSIEEMKKQLELGKEYQFIVELVKPQEKRIILKLAK